MRPSGGRGSFITAIHQYYVWGQVHDPCHPIKAILRYGATPPSLVTTGHRLANKTLPIVMHSAGHHGIVDARLSSPYTAYKQHIYIAVVFIHGDISNSQTFLPLGFTVVV